jgi:peptidoglycan/xylan/chitin deacetylase (PgdA/CDA1 family)
MANLLTRSRNKIRRTLASRLHRRELAIAQTIPLVSFSFDDAPVTAFERGGAVLESHGARGTYFVSLGLAGTVSDTGPIGGAATMTAAHGRGHELGCHTFDHHDAWHVAPDRYIASIDANKRALEAMLPGVRFRSFAYPKSGATHRVKPALAERFDCCRGGGQSFNSGVVDLNLLQACFIDRRAGTNLDELLALIDANAERRGWLIFAAHDISERTDDFACSESQLEALVRHAIASGAQILPVADACDRLHTAAPSPNR